MSYPTTGFGEDKISQQSNTATIEAKVTNPEAREKLRSAICPDNEVETAFQILERLIELEKGEKHWYTEFWIFRAIGISHEQFEMLKRLYKTGLVNRLVVAPETTYSISDTGRKLYEELTNPKT